MKTVTHAGRNYLAATLILLSFRMAGLVSTAAAQVTASAATQTDISAELKGSLDSKHAQVGQQVMASTTAKAMVGETALPKGTQLIGHVTSVSQYAKGESQGEVGMVFDQARLKDGTMVPIHSSLRSIAPPVSAQGNTQADVSGGGYGGGGYGGAGAQTGLQTSTSARVGGGGLLRGTTGAVGGLAGGVANTTRGAVGGVADTGSALVGGVAHTTGGLVAGVSNIPGVALSTGVDANTSGVVSAAGRDVKLDSGTQLALGVVLQ